MSFRHPKPHGLRSDSANLNFNLRLLRTNLPVDWTFKNPCDAGYCYLHLYPQESHQKVAYLIGAYPLWGTIKSTGGWSKTVTVRAKKGMNGAWHITTGGVGISPQELQIPDDAIIGASDLPMLSIYTLLYLTLFLCTNALIAITFGVFYWIYVPRMDFKIPTAKIGDVKRFCGPRKLLLLMLLTSSNADIPIFEPYRGLDRMNEYYKLPIGFEDIHENYLENLTYDDKDYDLCHSDFEGRKKLIELDIPEDLKISYIREMCPQLPDSDVWWRQAKILIYAIPKKRKSLKEVSVALLDKVQTDILDVVGSVEVVHDVIKEHTNSIVKIIGTDVSSTIIFAQDAHDVIRDNVGEMVTKIGYSAQFVKDVVLGQGALIDSIVSETTTLVVGVRERLPTAIDALTTYDVIKQETKEAILAMANHMPNGATVGDTIGSVVKDSVLLTGGLGQTLGGSVFNLVTAFWERVPTSDEFADLTLETIKDSKEYIIRKSTQIGTIAFDKALAVNLREEVVNIIDNTPWLAMKYGETLGAPFKGMIAGADISGLADVFKKWRIAIFGQWSASDIKLSKSIKSISLFGHHSSYHLWYAPNTIMVAIITGLVAMIIGVSIGGNLTTNRTPAVTT